jgi:hypothetical protein
MVFGRTDIGDPNAGLCAPPPWGNSFVQRWGFQADTEPNGREAWPVDDIRTVLERVKWWRNRARRPDISRQPCPLPALAKDKRAAVRGILKRHGKPAHELLEELMADIRAELVKQADFAARRKAATSELFGAASAGRIVAWGCKGRRHDQHHAAERAAIPAHFFAHPDRIVRYHNWISESISGIGFGNIAINRAEVLSLRSQVRETLLARSDSATQQVVVSATVPEPEGAASPARRRTSNGRDYRERDAPLVAEMRAMIAAGKASSSENAALAVVDRAEGGGMPASKVKRLALHYRQSYPAQS